MITTPFVALKLGEVVSIVALSLPSELILPAKSLTTAFIAIVSPSAGVGNPTVVPLSKTSCVTVISCVFPALSLMIRVEPNAVPAGAFTLTST